MSKYLLQKAIAVAVERHGSQTDRGGQLYVLHPLRIMMQMDTIEEKIVAVLHDVVEDTDITIDEVQDLCPSDNAFKAIIAITRRKNESYEEYIIRVIKNDIARKVKIADLIDNLDMSRLKKVTEKDIERMNKYQKTLALLRDNE